MYVPYPDNIKNRQTAPVPMRFRKCPFPKPQKLFNTCSPITRMMATIGYDTKFLATAI